MRELLRVLIDLCRLRRGPQDLPCAAQLLGAACLAYLGFAAIVGTQLGAQEGDAPSLIGHAAVSLVVDLGGVYLMLRMRGLGNRFVQTGSALVLTGLLFDLVALPAAVALGTPTDAQSLSPGQVLLLWLVLGLMVWRVCVWAHILRHGLETSFAGGVLLAIVLALIDLVAGRVLLGGT